MNHPKVIRDGKVAILYSPGYGAGWYTWNTSFPQCLFSPEIVNMIERGETVTESYCEKLFGDGFYAGGCDELEIKWLPEGTAFDIDEYDGSESVITHAHISLTA